VAKLTEPAPDQIPCANDDVPGAAAPSPRPSTLSAPIRLRLDRQTLPETTAALVRRLASQAAELERTRTELATVRASAMTAEAELERMRIEYDALRARVADNAHHDPLTGLANRSRFQERLDHAMEVGERGVAVVWIDLDHFKEINDIFGHGVGDEMLVAVADRLREIVRESDDIARMGGDEFAIVLENVTEPEAVAVARRALDALNDSAAFRLQLGASVGVSWQRRAAGDGRGLVRRADEAMYRAKAAGGGLKLAS